MKIRLADVALRAGVSEATVSRAVNGKPGVSEGQRQRVLRAVEELGYSTPPRQRAKAGLVGLIVPELDNPIFPTFAEHIESALIRQGYACMLGTQTLGGIHEDEYVRIFLDRNVAGIIFVSGIHANLDSDVSRYAALRQRGVPIVLINGYVPGIDAPCLSADDAAAISLSVEHLAALGHRRIGLAVGPPRYVPVHRKITSFHTSMRAFVDATAPPAAIEELIVSTVFTVEGGIDATEQLLDRGVTAVICGSDVMAMGALRTARRRGLRLPRDLSVIGSDDISLAEFIEPPLTTIHQPVAEIAEAATRALLSEISGDHQPRAEYLFRPHLVVRESTSAPRRTPRRQAATWVSPRGVEASPSRSGDGKDVPKARSGLS
jgi:DNA-binding LacI/PurR family transcriptional regulator